MRTVWCALVLAFGLASQAAPDEVAEMRGEIFRLRSELALLGAKNARGRTRSVSSATP